MFLTHTDNYFPSNIFTYFYFSFLNLYFLHGKIQFPKFWTINKFNVVQIQPRVIIIIIYIKRNFTQLTVSSNTIGHPIHSFQIGRFRCPHDDVLHIPPSQISVGLEGEGAYTGCQGRRCRRARVAGRAKVMQVSGHHLFLPRWTGTVGRSQGGRARLAVPRHLAVLRRAADGQRPDAVRVTVAVAVVVIPAAVPRRPDENRPSTVATLTIKATSLTRPPWNSCSKTFLYRDLVDEAFKHFQERENFCN